MGKCEHLVRSLRWYSSRELEDVMPIRIGHFEDMSDEELEQLRRHKHYRGDPALHELLSRVEAGMAQKEPIQEGQSGKGLRVAIARAAKRSDEHTSELQSHVNLVCRLLLE